MVAQGQLRRLQLGGTIALAVVALMVIAQLVMVQWRYQTAPAMSERLNQSGLRRAMVLNVLYRAHLAIHSPIARLGLADAITALRLRQSRLNDLANSDLDTYDAFVSTATELQSAPDNDAKQSYLGELGSRLYVIYDQATKDYAAATDRLRATLRDLVLLAGAIILIAIALLYFFVARPRDAAIFAAMRDIDERRQRFAAMFDNSAEMMVLYGPDGTVVRANEAAVERMGYGYDIVGQHYHRHLTESERERFDRRFAQALAGTASEFESTFLDAHKNDIPVMAGLAPVVVNTRIVNVVGSANDMRKQRRAEEDLLRSREQFRSLFEYNARPIIAMTPDGIITLANLAFQQLSGYQRDELIGKSALMLVSPDRREMTRMRLKGFEKVPRTIYEGLTLTKHGQEIPVEVEVSPIRVHDIVEGYFVKYRDLTRERAIALAVSGKDERMRALYRVASSNESASVQIGAALSLGARGLGMPYGFVCSLSGDTLEVLHRFAPNETLMPIGFKMQLTRAIGLRIRESPRAIAINDLAIDPDAHDLTERGLPWKSYIGTRIIIHDQVCAALVFLDSRVRATPFDDADLDFVDIVGTMIGSALARDLHDRELEQQAFHDTLTGAVNRRLLEEHVSKAIARAHRLRGTLALHFLDLNRFKAVNDEHGHEAGDQVLREVFRRLNSVARDQDVVARLGGDEFVVLETDLAHDADATALSPRIRAAFAKPMVLPDGTPLKIRYSIGTAVYPRDGATLRDLLKRADEAMYAMKHTR